MRLLYAAVNCFFCVRGVYNLSGLEAHELSGLESPKEVRQLCASMYVALRGHKAAALSPLRNPRPRNLDTLIKNPGAAFRPDSSLSLRRHTFTPHAFGSARLDYELLGETLQNGLFQTFYDVIKLTGF